MIIVRENSEVAWPFSFPLGYPQDLRDTLGPKKLEASLKNDYDI